MIEVERVAESTKASPLRPSRIATAVSLASAAADPKVSLPTGLDELDRVLGGGLVRGSVSLLGGEPGIGKSTLILQLCAAVAKKKGRCLIVTGEESVDQVGRRAERLGANLGNVMLIAESEVEVALATAAEVQPALLIVDSVQTMTTGSSSSGAGSVTQVRESAAAFTSYAKENNVATVLVGHVTKEGNLAGPRVLEHMVDTVLEFEGDRHSTLRFLRTVKHRFGATDEVGVLEMMATGLESVSDASALFLEDRHKDVPGSVVVPTMNGKRPLLVEVQSLVVFNEQHPRRYAQGLDSNRLTMINAVLHQHAGVPTSGKDVYGSVIGGMRIDDPGTDLAVALAIASTIEKIPVASDVIAIGEIGLSGDVRKASHIQKRLAESHRMGFTRAIVPESTLNGPSGLQLIRVKTVSEAVGEALLAQNKRRAIKRATAKHDDTEDGVHLL